MSKNTTGWSARQPQPVSRSSRLARADRDEQHERPITLAGLGGQNDRVIPVAHRLRHFDPTVALADPSAANLPDIGAA